MIIIVSALQAVIAQTQPDRDVRRIGGNEQYAGGDMK